MSCSGAHCVVPFFRLSVGSVDPLYLRESGGLSRCCCFYRFSSLFSSVIIDRKGIVDVDKRPKPRSDPAVGVGGRGGGGGGRSRGRGRNGQQQQDHHQNLFNGAGAVSRGVHRGGVISGSNQPTAQFYSVTTYPPQIDPFPMMPAFRGKDIVLRRKSGASVFGCEGVITVVMLSK